MGCSWTEIYTCFLFYKPLYPQFEIIANKSYELIVKRYLSETTKSLDIRIYVVGSRVQTLARRSAIPNSKFLPLPIFIKLPIQDFLIIRHRFKFDTGLMHLIVLM